MNLDFDSGKPIFLQIADGIEDAICTGAFPEESQIPSITEFSVTYRINPATALKGINLLVDEVIIYKKKYHFCPSKSFLLILLIMGI